MTKAANVPARASESRIKQVDLSTVVFVLMLMVFVGTSTYLAMNLKREIIPDERHHIGVSEYFATSWGIPPDVPETYVYGTLQHKPFLYYWMNGRLINGLEFLFPNPGAWKILVLLRLSNVLYGALAVLFCYLLAKEVIAKRWWQLLPVFLLTNTLMFVFLAGGVNYDNLANLSCFAGVFYLARLLKGQSFYVNSLMMMACLLFGMLVKFTVAPLLAVVTVVWFIYSISNRRQLAVRPAPDWKLLSTLALFGVLIIFNFAIYGVNLIRFRAVIPDCTMVLSKDQCMKNPVFARDEQRRLPEKLTLEDTLNGNAPGPVTWFETYWIKTITKKIFGIFGHRTYYPSDLMLTLYRLWFIGVMLIILRIWHKPSPVVTGLTATVFLYGLIILQTNLSSELAMGFKHMGIQGRYLFPVFSILYVIMAFYLASIPNKVASGTTLLLTLALFVWGGPMKTLLVPAQVPYPSARLIPEVHTIEIGSGLEVSQDFTSECTGTITEMDLLVAPAGDIASYPVRVLLVNRNTEQLVEEQVVRAEPIDEQTWISILKSPLTTTFGQPFRLRLTAADSGQKGNLQLWNTTTDVYPKGDAIVHGTPTNSDLIFRYTCQKPILADWFITSEAP